MMQPGKTRVAIQGEAGSNSHVAVLNLFRDADLVPCRRSAQVLEEVVAGSVHCAVLPVENTLHGSVAEHYDLLLEHPVRLAGEVLVHVRHNVIALPGARLAQIRRALSHPVALSQCRRWLATHPEISAEPFYDTAGSVKSIVEGGERDAAGIAPCLAAEVYGGEVLVHDIQDHAQNYTRFHVIARSDEHAGNAPAMGSDPSLNKLSVAFTLEHRPGTLVRALGELASIGVDLTRIESRPVHGSPWEYVFFVDMRYDQVEQADRALRALRPLSGTMRELGRYRAAEPTSVT